MMMVITPRMTIGIDKCPGLSCLLYTQTLFPYYHPTRHLIHFRQQVTDIPHFPQLTFTATSRANHPAWSQTYPPLAIALVLVLTLLNYHRPYMNLHTPTLLSTRPLHTNPRLGQKAAIKALNSSTLAVQSGIWQVLSITITTTTTTAAAAQISINTCL